MKKLFLLVFIALGSNVYSQKIKDSILSKKLDKYKQLTIALPASYNKDTKKTYPILLLLDGDYLFDPFQGALSYGN